MTSSGDHNTPTRPPRRLSSLRGRYLTATLLLAGGIISFVILLHTYINTTRSERLTNIEARHLSAYNIRLLRESVLNVEKELQSFLWSPSEEQRLQVHTAIDQTQQRQGELLAIGWLEHNVHQETLQGLERELRNLHGELDHVMDTRLDKQLQFPAMPIITSDINPGNSEFLAAVRLAIEESAASGAALPGSTLQRLLNRLRNDWLLMVSQFRMYIANRIGALIDSEAAAQEHDIELLYAQIDVHLKELTRLERQGRLDLPLGESRQQMLDAATRWYSAYRAIKAIPPGAYWRLDAAFMQGTIAPLFQNVWQRLQRLDQAIEDASADDTRQLFHASENIIHLLWSMAVALLAAMLAGFILFERAILSPLALMARALRDEAHGKRDIALPLVATTETQHLVEAFTEMRRLVQERQHALEHQALHDALTGLPNRTLLQDRLQQGIHHLRRQGAGSLALLMMDLDGFKEVNDTLGHPIGDGILRQLSERLTQLLRETDTVARMGGDEFGILLEEADETEARRTGSRILQLLERPFEVAGQSLYVSGSIGIALYPRHALNPEELSRRADVAMYVAKREKNGITVYDTRQDHYTLQRLARGSDLRNAINDEQLQLHFQPLIDLRTNTYAGVEALLRWEHPQRGFIPPEEFIPIAEQTGMIRHLTYWVLDQALARCAAWRHRGLPPGSLAVNLSAYNLQDTDLSLEVDRLLRKWGVPPYLLTLEITEGSMMANPSRALATLEKLNDIGVQLAIDDFGTGFSSLSYLKQLPVDKLKIDKSFVIQMEEDENDAMIVHSTIDLAHNLGLEVVAEGVETAEALALLQTLKCDIAQGYLFSKPMSAMDLEDWLSSSPYCRLELPQDEGTLLSRPPTTH